MTDGGVAEAVKYETRTLKCVRGMESRTAAKWEAQGWEVVSQTSGRISSELTLRRPKPKTPWVLVCSLFGGVAVVIVVIIIVNAVTGGSNTADPYPEVSSSHSAQSEPAEEEPSAGPSESGSEAPADPEPTESAANDALVVGPDVEDTTVDELLDRLNGAGMGGIEVGDQFRVTGTLAGSEYWFTGATGDYIVNLAAYEGANDLQVLLADASLANDWTDGTVVDFVLQNVDKTIDGETTDGWMQVVEATSVY